MAVGLVDRQKLVNIADAVRAKKGITGNMTLDAIASNITSMPTAKNNANFDFSGSGSKSNSNPLSYLTKIDLSGWDTSNVTNMSFMFQNCNSITSLDVSGFNTSMVTYMSSMFKDCSSLTSLDLSNFNTSKVSNMSDMFRNCSKLSNLTLGTDWASNSSISSFDLSYCPLTHESAVDVINKLSTRNNSPVITFSNKVYLYQSEIDIATNKGWSVSGCSVLVEAESANVEQYTLIDGVLSRCVYVADTPQSWGQRIFISSLYATDSKGNTSFEWGENGFATGVTKQDIGNGLTNTNELIAMNLKPSGVKPTIWDAIKEFRNTHSGRWFIPSRNELGIIINNYTYRNIWSSTEFNSTVSYASNPNYIPNTITKDKTELYSVLPFTYV